MIAVEIDSCGMVVAAIKKPPHLRWFFIELIVES